MGSSYEQGDLETRARSVEEIEAVDEDVEATVTVEVEAPHTEAASVACDVIATANRSIVDRVFSGGQAPPQEAPDEDDEDEGPAKIMGYDGGDDGV